MRKRRLLIPLLCIGLALALAQDLPAVPPTQMNLDIRLAIVESRMTRLESDVAALAQVPAQLARMEATLQNVAEKTNNQGGLWQQLGVGVTMALISSIVAFQFGRKSK